MERLRLVQKLQAAELHLVAAGLDVAPLRAVRQALLAKPLALGEPMFPTPPPPPVQADGTQRLRYLKVSERRRV